MHTHMRTCARWTSGASSAAWDALALERAVQLHALCIHAGMLRRSPTPKAPSSCCMQASAGKAEAPRGRERAPPVPHVRPQHITSMMHCCKSIQVRADAVRGHYIWCEGWLNLGCTYSRVYMGQMGLHQRALHCAGTGGHHRVARSLLQRHQRGEHLPLLLLLLLLLPWRCYCGGV